MLRSLVLSLLFVSSVLSQEPPLKSREVPLNLIATLEDAACVADTVYGEAAGEPLAGKRAVVDVIQERMQSRDMAACEVVSEPGQFAGYNKHRKVTKEQLTTLAVVVNMQAVAEKAEYFHTMGISPHWKHVKRLIVVGKHVFYTKEKQNE